MNEWYLVTLSFDEKHCLGREDRNVAVDTIKNFTRYRLSNHIKNFLWVVEESKAKKWYHIHVLTNQQVDWHRWIFGKWFVLKVQLNLKYVFRYIFSKYFKKVKR